MGSIEVTPFSLMVGLNARDLKRKRKRKRIVNKLF